MHDSIHGAAPDVLPLDEASLPFEQPDAHAVDELAEQHLDLNLDLNLDLTKQLEVQRLHYEGQIALLTLTAKNDLAAFVGKMR